MVKIVAGSLKYDLTDLKGISESKRSKLTNIGIFNVEDLSSGSRLQRRKLANKFSGQLKKRLVKINERGYVRDEDLTQAALSEREQLRAERKQQQQAGPDPTEVGFQSAERPREDFEQAFETFTSEFESANDPIPVAEMGRSVDLEGSAQPLVNAATSRVTFAPSAQPEDFEQELEQETERLAESRRKDPATPGKQRDAFVEFVDERFGLGATMEQIGDFEVPKEEYEEALETHRGRTSRERDVDERKRAPITTNLEQWDDNPRYYDFPGVDTPSVRPDKNESDLPFK